MGLIHHGRYYYFLPTHSADDLRRYSPGRLLLRRNLQWCFEEGLEFFDFTIGNEPYKADWCDGTLKLYDSLEALTRRGRAYALHQKLLRYLHSLGIMVQGVRTLRRFAQRLGRIIGGSGAP